MTMNLANFLVLLFLLTPVISFIWFIVSLIFFFIRLKSGPARKPWLIQMIVSGSIATITIGTIITVVTMFFLSFSGM